MQPLPPPEPSLALSVLMYISHYIYQARDTSPLIFFSLDPNSFSCRSTFLCHILIRFPNVDLVSPPTSPKLSMPLFLAQLVLTPLALNKSLLLAQLVLTPLQP